MLVQSPVIAERSPELVQNIEAIRFAVGSKTKSFNSFDSLQVDRIVRSYILERAQRFSKHASQPALLLFNIHSSCFGLHQQSAQKSNQSSRIR